MKFRVSEGAISTFCAVLTEVLPRFAPFFNTF